MSGVNGSNPGGPGGSHPMSLPLGMAPHPHFLASREQEMIQNDLYRRACTDPALAQQVRLSVKLLNIRTPEKLM